MTDQNEIDRVMVDQPMLFARMLEAIAQLGEIQKVIAKSLVDVHMTPDHKMLVSGNLAGAINAMNRASHLIMHASITDSATPGAYPISSFTYILVYEDAKDAAKGKAVAEFLKWAIHDGQKFADALHYAPLPDAVVKKVETKLETLRSGDKKLLSGS